MYLEPFGDRILQYFIVNLEKACRSYFYSDKLGRVQSFTKLTINQRLKETKTHLQGQLTTFKDIC